MLEGTTAEIKPREALRINPRYSGAWDLLGNIDLVTGKLDQAAVDLHTALKLDPGNLDAHMQLGRVALQQAHYEESLTEFGAVANARPQSPEPHYWIGVAWERQKKSLQAANEFAAAIKLQPDFVEGLNDLAWILASDPNPRMRNGPMAVKLATRACALTRNTQPVLIGTLGAALAEAGQFDEAAAAAQKAHDLALSMGQKAVADKNAQLIQLYHAHHAYRETQ